MLPRSLCVKMQGFHPSLACLCSELLEEEELLLSQQTQQTASADAVRTPSESEGEESAAGLRPPSTWWSKLLVKHAPPPEREIKNVTVVSGCTGAAAEVAVFQAQPTCVAISYH